MATKQSKPVSAEKRVKTLAPANKRKSSRAEMFGYYKDKIWTAEGDVFNLGL